MKALIYVFAFIFIMSAITGRLGELMFACLLLSIAFKSFVYVMEMR